MEVFQEKLDIIKAERLAQRRRERMEKRRAEYAAAKKEEEAQQGEQMDAIVASMDYDVFVPAFLSSPEARGGRA